MFIVYLINPRDSTNPIKIGPVIGDDEVAITRMACAMIEEKYDMAELVGWGFEAIEFTGKKRQMAAIFKNVKTGS